MVNSTDNYAILPYQKRHPLNSIACTLLRFREMLHASTVTCKRLFTKYLQLNKSYLDAKSPHNKAFNKLEFRSIEFQSLLKVYFTIQRPSLLKPFLPNTPISCSFEHIFFTPPRLSSQPVDCFQPLYHSSKDKDGDFSHKKKRLIIIKVRRSIHSNSRVSIYYRALQYAIKILGSNGRLFSSIYVKIANLNSDPTVL